MDAITRFIEEQYALDQFPDRDRLTRLWEWFKSNRYSDQNFEQSFAPNSRKLPSHFQRFWEMALGHRLAHDPTVSGCLKRGESKKGGGPDWKIETPGNRVWIEATTPTYVGPDSSREDEKSYISPPAGAQFVQPEETPTEAGRWLRNDDPDSGGYGRTFPYTFILARSGRLTEVTGPERDAPVVENPVPPPYEPGDVVPILNANKSRWTQSLNEKAKKANDFLERKKIGDQEPLVIAVNTSLLMLPNFDGISQLPMAVEVLFGAGPRAIPLDPTTGKPAGPAYNTERRHFEIVKQSPKSISIDSAHFDQDCFKAVSAVIACDISPEIEAGLAISSWNAINDRSTTGRESIRWCLVHNPNATNPLPPGFLSSLENWRQEDYRTDRVLTCTPAETTTE